MVQVIVMNDPNTFKRKESWVCFQEYNLSVTAKHADTQQFQPRFFNPQQLVLSLAQVRRYIYQRRYAVSYDGHLVYNSRKCK